MKIQVLRVGPLATNCYLLADEQSGQCAVIDPGAQFQKKIQPALEQLGMKCAMILLTHGHYDHIMALKDLKDATGAPIYIHEKDAHMLTEDYLKGWKAAAAQGYRALEGGCEQREIIVPVELLTADNVRLYGTDGWQ